MTAMILCGVRAEVEIVGVAKSASMLRIGNCVVIEYSTIDRRNPLPGPSPIPVVLVGETYPAFPTATDKRCIHGVSLSCQTSLRESEYKDVESLSKRCCDHKQRRETWICYVTDLNPANSSSQNTIPRIAPHPSGFQVPFTGTELHVR